MVLFGVFWFGFNQATVFASFPNDFFFSHPLDLVLLSAFDVFMRKKPTNTKIKKDVDGEFTELTQLPLGLFRFRSLTSCLMAIAHSLFWLSLFLSFNFRFLFFPHLLVGFSPQSFTLVCWISVFQL